MSSVSFTPFEGMELINPNINKKPTADSGVKYFQATSGFSTVINANSVNSASTIMKMNK